MIFTVSMIIELLEIGLYDTLEINTLHFIEWPEIIPNNIINPDIIAHSHKLINKRNNFD